MPKTVLICDDEAYILESVSYVVHKEGFNVLKAEDGEQALTLARQHVPDLMFLDVEMPKKTGYEVSAALKAEPSTKNIYIIMLTARGQLADEKRGYEAQANEYITKPFSPRKLAKRLHEILDDSAPANP
jgi:DNA-binding response OmpR family regulator